MDTLRSKSGGNFTTFFHNGIASFQDLFVDKVGIFYLAKFSSNLSLPGENERFSSIFSVGIGPAERLIILEQPSNQCMVFGGTAFSCQPRVSSTL